MWRQLAGQFPAQALGMAPRAPVLLSHSKHLVFKTFALLQHCPHQRRLSAASDKLVRGPAPASGPARLAGPASCSPPCLNTPQPRLQFIPICSHLFQCSDGMAAQNGGLVAVAVEMVNVAPGSPSGASWPRSALCVCRRGESMQSSVSRSRRGGSGGGGACRRPCGCLHGARGRLGF